MWRHGDVLIASIEALPDNAVERKGAVLAYGEVTGHSHRFATTDQVQLWEQRGELFVEIKTAPATLIHEEHAPIILEPGLYRVWMQREYTPQGVRRVVD